MRVLIALRLKGLTPEKLTVVTPENAAEYRLRNPQGKVPSVVVGGQFLTQTAATLEYIEEVFSQEANMRSLLPQGPEDTLLRSTIRRIVQIISCDIQVI